jgi:hypothetical protein
MNYTVKQKTLERGVTVKVVLDETDNTECPIGSYDDAVRLVKFSRRNGTSDTACERGERSPFKEPGDVLTWAKANRFIVYPVFKYEHGNVAYKTSPFSCPWDSGQAGYLLLDRKEWPRRGKKSDTYAKAVLESYTSWCNGEVYGFVIEDEDGEVLGSCWGFIGEIDYCLEEGISAAEWHVKTIGEDKAKVFAEESEAARPDMYT